MPQSDSDQASADARSRRSDAIIVAPATFNTINKWARGISDTYALGLLAETTGMKVPTVVLPFANSALAGRGPFRRSVEELRHEGVRILLGPGGVQPDEPHTGSSLAGTYPWHLALSEAERILDSAVERSPGAFRVFAPGCTSDEADGQ